MIPLSVPNFEGNEEAYTHDAVSQGWVSTGGAYVDRLEQNLAEYAHAPAAVACQSGTAALHLSLIACGVGAGDLVIVPTLTFIAAVNPVKYLLADPVFMDCDDSLCMDAAKLADFCEQECHMEDGKLLCNANGRQIKAIVVVHVFGNWADMEGIMRVAEQYRLKVVEDATEAVGTVCDSGRYKGVAAGMVGDFGAFSFNGNKIITTGGGGAIVSRDAQALHHLKYLSTQAKDNAHFYIHNEVGYNYRMTNVQAALGVAQMEELPEFIRRKNRNYDLYAQLLKDCPTGTLLPFREGVHSNRWFYTFVLNRDVCPGDVLGYIQAMAEKGIETRPIWGLIHEQLPYRDCVAYRIEKAAYYSDRVINLPSSTNITEEQIRTVCQALRAL